MCTGCIIDQEDNFKAAAQQQQFGSTPQDILDTIDEVTKY